MNILEIDARELRPSSPKLRVGVDTNVEAVVHPELEGPHVAKRLAAPLSHADVERLGGQISWRDRLPPGEREQLDERVCWPRALLVDGSDCVGILTPRAPNSMMVTLGGTDYVPFTLGSIWPKDEEDRGQARVFRSLPERMALIGNFAATVRWLHARDVVIGDLHAGNVLAEVEGTAVRLVDADSMSGAWGRAPEMHPPLMRVFLDGVPASHDRDWFLLAITTIGVLTTNFSFDEYPEVIDRYVGHQVSRTLRGAVDGDVAAAADRQTWRFVAATWPKCLTPIGAYLPAAGAALVPWDGTTPDIDPSAPTQEGTSSDDRARHLLAQLAAKAKETRDERRAGYRRTLLLMAAAGLAALVLWQVYGPGIG